MESPPDRIVIHHRHCMHSSYPCATCRLFAGGVRDATCDGCVTMNVFDDDAGALDDDDNDDSALDGFADLQVEQWDIIYIYTRYIHTYIHTHLNISDGGRVYMHGAHISHVSVYMHMYVCLSICLSVCLSVCTYVCVSSCMPHGVRVYIYDFCH